MLRNYQTYIKELSSNVENDLECNFESNARTTIVYINKIVDKYLNINSIKRELEAKLLGKNCEWRIRRKSMKGIIIKIDVSKNFRKNDQNYTVYINEDAVDFSYPIYVFEDIKKRPMEIVGYPSGEVFYVSPEELSKLTNLKLVKYSRYFSVRGKDIENLYFFRDDSVKDIIYYLEIYRRNRQQDERYLEEHEIDDDYHIKQLYRDKNNNITFEKKINI